MTQDMPRTVLQAQEIFSGCGVASPLSYYLCPTTEWLVYRLTNSIDQTFRDRCVTLW